MNRPAQPALRLLTPRHGAQIVEEMFALVGIGDSRAGFAGHFQVSLGLVVATGHGMGPSQRFVGEGKVEITDLVIVADL